MPLDDNTLAVSPEQFAALSPDAQATLTAQLAKHYTPDQIGKVKGTAAAPTAKVAALPFGQDVKAPASPVPSRGDSGLSYETKVEAFKRLQSAGVDPVRIAEAAKAEGIDPKDFQITEAAPAERMSVEEANSRLASTSMPDAASLSPSDFQFTFDPAHIDGLDPAAVKDISDAFAIGFHAAGIPRQLGQSLFSEAMSSADKFAELSDLDRQLAFREEGARLQRLGNIDRIREDAEFAWSKLPQDFKDFATEHYLFHRADSYAALASAGALMRARESRKGK